MTATVDHIAGETYHGRRGATKNAFRYSIDYVLLDAEADLATPSLFSRNRAGLMSLHDTDHGGPPKQGRGAGWVRDVLQAHGIDAPDRIALLAQPRVLGHVFNPVSFWLCFDADDILRSVIAEVTNTFGDRHSYLCHHEDGREITKDETLSAKKLMHVSPFQPIEGGYSFRFDIQPDSIGIWIDYTRGNGGLIATLTGPRAKISNRSILWAALRRPFGSRRVLALIHWQALKLWFKGATFRSQPPPPTEEVSR
ncbi:DUF1365 domain-containing protein [Yoonia sediminilitoris]|uniref:Cyclopropane-fatty-acyl-phospholipid synthase n=1 Tax=Yoonia sediminilitoris TaxID=1286148 RepID=A0A2T6KN10_9RHOB|nr:DUF1365 domain-containing protein [Yoonia sediminilitoris]PUB17603.1 hypothetical protein C8N45_102615 [Yoonia sediminilitoris]RCW97898.1 hypothetical protein DFP92_102615 [Yoonia sediminilitoris]